MRFIDDRQRQEQPFFLYVAYTLPHFSSSDEDPHGLTVPSSEAYADAGWDEKSRKYAVMVDLLDRDVGRIIEHVDSSGLKRNTLVIFTSDNGAHSGIVNCFQSSGPLRGDKRDLTEGGIRVPFIARWPGTIPVNQTSDEVIAFQDMLPTFAELAGVTPPQGIDGISVVKALQGGKIDSSRISLLGLWALPTPLRPGRALARLERDSAWNGR